MTNVTCGLTAKKLGSHPSPMLLMTRVWDYFIIGSDNMSFDTGWRHISGVCSNNLEFSASSYQGHNFTAHFLPRTQNWTVQAVISCQLTVRHCLLTILQYACSNRRLFVADLRDIWHCKVVLQQKCASIALIIFIVNNNNTNSNFIL